MHILHFGKYFDPQQNGGIETYVDSLIQGSSAHHHVTNLVASTNWQTHQQKTHGENIVQVGSIANVASTSLCPTMPYWAYRLNKKTPFDIVHLHFPDPMSHVACLVLPKTTKKIITWHSDIIRQKNILKFYRPWLKEFLNSVDAVIVSNDKKTSFPLLYELIDDVRKIHVIPIGIEIEKFAFPNQDAVEKIKAQFKKPIIFALGRHVEYKGFTYLIEAMQYVSNAVLVLGGEGPLTEHLKQKVQKANLQDRIYFVGRIAKKDLVNYYHACEIFCMPSINPSEAYGIVQLEAMACAKPVVSCELNNGVSFVNQHKQTGLIVPPRDVNALAKALNALLQDESLRKQLGAYAKSRAQKDFTQQCMVERTLGLYTSLEKDIKIPTIT